MFVVTNLNVGCSRRRKIIIALFTSRLIWEMLSVVILLPDDAYLPFMTRKSCWNFKIPQQIHCEFVTVFTIVFRPYCKHGQPYHVAYQEHKLQSRRTFFTPQLRQTNRFAYVLFSFIVSIFERVKLHVKLTSCVA